MEHEFALYLDNLSLLLERQSNELIVIDDKDLFHRMVRVLRLSPGQKIILFDVVQHAQIVLEAFEGKFRVVGHVHAKNINIQLKPAIHFILPVLKREDLSDAVYGLVEAGVNSIQLVTTQKLQRKWGGDKELERLERVVIAAAEQAKQFALPTVHAPVELNEYLTQLNLNGLRLYADPAGTPLFDCMQQVRKKCPSELFVMIGPEGDLTPTEKDLVRAASFDFFMLTPTILRAKQAAPVSAAMFRAIL